MVNAKKERLGAKEALDLTESVIDLYVSKGKKVIHLNLSDNSQKPDDDELVNLMLGPTGNLRAPTLKVGKTMIVGFNDEAYQQVLKN
ncbi:MAG TPA: ArsC family (seleno)protein [Candidatus Melainabacteria bacterium]|nr:ArsC family (seleno)protein [Candidatus Melainabacteria bacterium]